jgi:hypothetical protein
MAILQALELKPELRFQSIEDFAQALGLPAPAHRPTEALGTVAALPVTSKLDKTTVVAVPESLMDAERLVREALPAKQDVAAPALPAASPVLAVSDKVVDLGPPGKRARTGQRIALANNGQGTLKGRVSASVPWISLNVREFTGDAVEMTISGRNRGLTPGHQRWPVPNLFTVLPGGLWRALTHSPWRALLWVALIAGIAFVVVEPPVRPLLFAAGLLLGGATAISQVLLLLVAWQVSWFVPAPRQHVGQVRVETNGGTGQIEVRMLARPGFVRKALGWLVATLLLLAELVALGWLLIYGTF